MGIRRGPLAAAVSVLMLAVAGCGSGNGAVGTPSPTVSPQSPAAEEQAPESVTGASGWIAYQSISPRGPDGIFLVRADGSDEHEILTDVPGRRLHPDFSPDGNRIAFDQSEGATDQLWVANSDGTDPRLLAACDPSSACLQRWEPAWSPDGLRLAISTATGTEEPEKFGIAIVDVSTGAVTQVVDHPAEEGQDHFPRWSPDGTTLAFWRWRSNGGAGETAVFTVTADGQDLRQLTDWEMMAADPDWSPDGERILFGTYPLLDFPTSGNSELFTMAPDGSDVQQLTDYGPAGPRATQPRWSPEGDAILYVRTTQRGTPRLIYAMAADGSSDGPVLDTHAIYTHPDLQPHPG